MTGIFAIVDVTRRCMGHHYIRPAAAPQRKTHPTDEPGHLLFGVLISTAIIPSAAGETDKSKVIEGNYLPVDVAAAYRGGSGIAQIMIAEHIHQRNIETMPQCTEEFRRKVPTGNNEINILVFLQCFRRIKDITGNRV